MESQLFQHFFPREDEESGALSPLVEPLCMVLYDMLRPAFIHLQDLDDLCELVDILQHEARLQGCKPEAGYSITFATSHRLMAGTSSQVSQFPSALSPTAFPFAGPLMLRSTRPPSAITQLAHALHVLSRTQARGRAECEACQEHTYGHMCTCWARPLARRLLCIDSTVSVAIWHAFDICCSVYTCNPLLMIPHTALFPTTKRPHASRRCSLRWWATGRGRGSSFQRTSSTTSGVAAWTCFPTPWCRMWAPSRASVWECAAAACSRGGASGGCGVLACVCTGG